MLLSAGRQGSVSEAEVCFYGRVRRACDSCRARKIRCNGCQPCNSCSKSKSRSACTFFDMPGKKGPRKLRAEKSGSEMSSPDNHEQAGHHHQTSSSSAPSPSLSPPGDLLYSASSHQSDYPPVSVFVGESQDGYDLSLGAHLADPSEGLPSIQESASPSLELPGALPMGSSAVMISDTSGDGDGHLDTYFHQQASVSCTSLPPRAFLPLIEVFFEQLFSIMPVLDRKVYLDSDLLRGSSPLSSRDYCMLTAASALTAVQLSLPVSVIQQGLPSLSTQLLVDECLRERRQSDYIEDPDISTVLTSFFLFGYYGNLQRHGKARHYLHEAISFAESIGLDDEDCLSRLPPKQGQQHRIVFWLLFVTERAYALQRDNHVKIHTTAVNLPSIFESEDPRLMYGFVSLVNVFLTIDQTFLSVWAGTQKQDVMSRVWLTEALRRLESPAIPLAESLEKHRLDVSISQHWLRVLLWKVCAKQGLLTLGSTDDPFNLQFPIRLARDVVKATSNVSQAALDSHGIGMEQKIADIAGCLADVLKCAQGDVSEPFRQGREYLMALLLRLSQIRGAPSHYFQPLLAKVDATTCQMISPLSSVTEGAAIEDGHCAEFAAVGAQDDQDYGEWSQSLD